MKTLNHNIFFRINDSDYALLKARAKATGLSYAGYLRQILRGFEPKEKPSPEYYEMLETLRDISSNLNMIALRLSVTGDIDKEKYKENVQMLRDSIVKIMKAVTVPERRKKWP